MRSQAKRRRRRCRARNARAYVELVRGEPHSGQHSLLHTHIVCVLLSIHLKCLCVRVFVCVLIIPTINRQQLATESRAERAAVVQVFVSVLILKWRTRNTLKVLAASRARDCD